jgi:cyd operon protein YbgT
MWYFSWILGVGVALAAGVIGALWFEAREQRQAQRQGAQPRIPPRETSGPRARGVA